MSQQCPNVNWIAANGSVENGVLMVNNANAMGYVQMKGLWSDGGTYHEACELATQVKTPKYTEFWNYVRDEAEYGFDCVDDLIYGQQSGIPASLNTLNTAQDSFNTADDSLNTEFDCTLYMFKDVVYHDAPVEVDCTAMTTAASISEAQYDEIVTQVAVTSNALTTYNTRLATSNSAALGLASSVYSTFNAYTTGWKNAWQTQINSANSALTSVIYQCDYHLGPYHYPPLSQACKDTWTALKNDCLAFRADLATYNSAVVAKHTQVVSSDSDVTVNVMVQAGSYLVAHMHSLCYARTRLNEFDAGTVLWCIEYRSQGIQAALNACNQCT